MREEIFLSGPFLLVSFLAALILMVLLIVKLKLHPSLAILLVVLILGLITTGPENALELTYSGFAGTLKSIGIVIFLGTVMGQILEESGAAISITNATINLVGEKNIDVAIAVSAAILGIAVFADSVVIILIPIVSAIASYTNRSMAGLGTLLYISAYITHSLVPPTPGPLAAAAVLKIDIGTAIIWGLIVAVPTIIASLFYCRRLEKKIYIKGQTNYDNPNNMEKLPNPAASFMPIVLSILFITVSSLVENIAKKGSWTNILSFLGDPSVALLIGTFVAIGITGRWDKTVLNDWVEKGISGSAMPIMVTGLGGALAALLKDSPLSNELANIIAKSGLPPILVPFIISATVCTITGSNTVGVLTGAAIMEPMVSTLGISRLATFLACASGGQWVKLPNSSIFWITSTMSNMDLPTAIKTITLVSLVSGAVSFGVTLLLMFLGLI